MKRFLRIILVFCCLGVLEGGISVSTGWAATESTDYLNDDFYDSVPVSETVGDPLEPFNRVMFKFNDFSYTWVLSPLATGYAHVVPFELRGLAANFIYNLKEPVRVVSALLQGRLSEAGIILTRFGLNSTIGIAGLDDFADRELAFHPIDVTFGEALAFWGVGDGCYLVVPFYGSTTLRDFTGDMVEGLTMSPYYYWANSWKEITAIYLAKELNKVSLHLGEYEDLKQLSFDPYIALRNGYFQYRKRLREGKNKEVLHE